MAKTPKLDWSLPICTSHETPHIGTVQPDCPLSGRKRVLVASPSCVTAMPTVFRYDADGKTRGDGNPSPADLVNFDPSDGAVRITTTGATVVCDGNTKLAA